MEISSFSSTVSCRPIFFTKINVGPPPYTRGTYFASVVSDWDVQKDAAALVNTGNLYQVLPGTHGDNSAHVAGGEFVIAQPHLVGQPKNQREVQYLDTTPFTDPDGSDRVIGLFPISRLRLIDKVKTLPKEKPLSKHPLNVSQEEDESAEPPSKKPKTKKALAEELSTIPFLMYYLAEDWVSEDNDTLNKCTLVRYYIL